MTSQGETQVTVEFFEQGDSTEILLTQEFFPSTKRRDEDYAGWNACFDALGRYLQSQVSR